MINHMDKILIACMGFAAAAALYLAMSGTLLYVG